jgi:hypothetical protein
VAPPTYTAQAAAPVYVAPAPATPADPAPVYAPAYPPAPTYAAAADPAAYPAPAEPSVPPPGDPAAMVSDEPSVLPPTYPASSTAPYPATPAARVARITRRRTATDTVPPSGPTRSSVRLDELMSLHEWETSGVSRLRAAEVTVLEHWVERYHQQIVDSVTRALAAASASPAAAPRADIRASMPPISRSPDGTPKNAHAIVVVRAGGHYITLDDNSVWDIYAADQAESANWQNGDLVQVRQSPVAYGEYDHDLVNTQKTGPVRAKFMGYARPDAPQ